MALNADAQKRKHYFPAWTYHESNANIYGLSCGISDFIAVEGEVHTYGVRVSLIGEGILSFMMPCSPVPLSDSAFENVYQKTVVQRVNGLNLSGSGTMCSCNVNGFSAGFVTQVLNRMNGLSVMPAQNYVLVSNGIQVAGLFNETYKMRGIQIGAHNKSYQTRGIQIGLWNINEKRKMPLINWNFSKKQIA